MHFRILWYNFPYVTFFTTINILKDRVIMEQEKHYDHAASERQAQELWEKEKVYAFQNESLKEVFSIDTPPPTVSGSLHIGHIFSYVHADLIARYKRMKGYNVFYPMGFDDNGLATERYVEKKNSTKAHLMKRSEFIDLCLKETIDAEKMFENLWRSIGLSIDWSKVYSTISKKVRRASQHSFIDLYQKGLAYRKLEPSLYCTTCRTSVAQAELDSSEISSIFNHIVFKTEDGNDLIIGTTRPELLPSCVAVFYNPLDERYTSLAGKKAIVPIYNKKVPIIADVKVDRSKGSGLVMCCTFGDQTDIYWYKTYKLPLVQSIGLDGRWTEETGTLQGLKAHEARKEILDLLRANGILEEQKSITHSVNTHERCKQEIEYLVLAQWFIKILDHKESFINRADQINWYPEFMKARYKDWVQNLHWDWGISRQRFFGIPFPAWHCVDCGEILLPDASMLPIDPQEQPYPGLKCTKCGSKSINPDTDVMDTWNTSSLTPHINIGWPDKSADNLTLPMSMRPQAHDIIRTWAFDTIVKAHFHNNTIPWRDIVISGHVLAGKGEKISKSKGGSKITPESLLEQYPADVIRYWSSHGKLGTDTAFSENQLKIGMRLLTKMWNAFRFIKEHSIDAGIILCQTSTTQDPLNQWLLHKGSDVYKEFQQNFDEYEYQTALECIERFFWHDVCDNYLELIKDRLFNPTKYAPAIVEETRNTLYLIGYELLQLFAPFLPHITETLYQLMYQKTEKEKSLHTVTFDTKRFSFSFDDSVKSIDKILDIVCAVRKLKSEHQMSLKTDIDSLIVYTTNECCKNALQRLGVLVCGITRAKQITLDCGACEESCLTTDGSTVIIRVKIV